MRSDKQLGGTGSRNFDLAPDGKRVVALVLLENFLDELWRKLPTGNSVTRR